MGINLEIRFFKILESKLIAYVLVIYEYVVQNLSVPSLQIMELN